MRLGKSGEAFFIEKNSDVPLSPPDTPVKDYSRQSSQTSAHSRKHSRSSKPRSSKSTLSAESSDIFQDAFDPSSALSDSEIEVNRYGYSNFLQSQISPFFPIFVFAKY